MAQARAACTKTFCLRAPRLVEVEKKISGQYVPQRYLIQKTTYGQISNDMMKFLRPALDIVHIV